MKDKNSKKKKQTYSISYTVWTDFSLGILLLVGILEILYRGQYKK